jgi:hypothetical protein
MHDIDDHRIISKNTENITTYVCGVDFNSLYPSAYSSIKTNKIAYTDGKLLMFGGVKLYTVDKNRIAQVIQSREELFIVSVKRRIPEEWNNKFLEFLPIFRNLMVCKQKKLMQLFSTMGQLMTFNNYYLWYLMDFCHFIVED